MRKPNCLDSICLMSLHVKTLCLMFSHQVHAPCLGCATAMARCLLSSKWWISSETILCLFFVVSFNHHHCEWRPKLVLSVATEPIISFILREDSASQLRISRSIFDVLLWQWRCPWCNGYRRRIWTRRHEFKSWTWLIAFHIALKLVGKVWIQIFSLQLYVNSRAD